MENNFKICHLCSDDKFIDNAISIFESAFPGKNIIFAYTKGQKPKFIKRKIHYDIGAKDVIFGINNNSINSADVVVIHSLSNAWFRTIEKLNKKVPIVWIGWGFDYYDIIDPNDDRLLEKTFSMEKKRHSRRKLGMKQRIQSLLNSMPRKKKVIERIDFFSPVLSNEYNLLKSAHTWKRFPRQVDWNYSPSEKDLSHYVNSKESSIKMGVDILIGNSATSTNNHLEIFDILEKIDIKNCNLVVPLSYGDSSYGAEVKEIGEMKFGSNFDALIDFMPIEEYMQKIGQCGFVIMNHVRQQAVGNTIIMAYMGAKVFLRKETPTYEFFKGVGLNIFSVQELENQPSLLTSHLKIDQVLENRIILDRIWSHSTLIEKTKKLIFTVINKNKEG
jgi:dTDP-N-acetylfucosamine:lipid II N-acetylfucosaminyltransferase